MGVAAADIAGTILVVDDDPDVADSLANLLRLERYHVAVAYAADRATAVLAEERPQVALVDIRLGHGNGVDLVRALRQATPDLVAVMMTAYASIDTAIEALQAGAYDYLSKPLHTADLLATLDRCFERIRLQAERERAEQQLLRAQRLDAIGQLTGGMAHDFNNLLAVILGNLRLIEDGVADRPALRELVEDALGATRSGVELTSRLLAFGRAPPPHPERTDLARLVPGIVRLLAPMLGADIAVALDIAPAVRPVRVDRSQFEACLINLAINARDAMPDGGTLRLEIRDEGAAGVAVSVIDTGTGMPPEILTRVTEPFFTTKSTGRGNGLGLSMVDGFARRSGGTLAIASAEGHGTRITLTLPADDGAEAVAISAAPAPRGRGERIFLVEDQPDVRAVVRRQLEHLGYRVIEAADAAQALARLADQGTTIDLLLTDVALPGPMSGVALGQAVLARRPGLPVILTTGHAPDTLLARTDPIAGAAVLRKPVEPETLTRAILAALYPDGGTNM